MPDNILVLGARIKDNGEPGKILASRLDRALELSRLPEHAGKKVVVSGAGESVPMARYLRDCSCPLEVLEEPEASSTNENLENAQRLLPNTKRWLVVTSDYHALRTRVWGWHLGIPLTVVPAVTPAPQRGRAFFRELFALPHSSLRVLWRKLRA